MRKSVAVLVFSVIFIVFILVLGAYHFASARSSGMSGYSTSGCAPCHSSSASSTITVSIDGLTTVSVEETNTYTITVTGEPSEVFGFDLSVTDGTIIRTDTVNTQFKGSDLTHTANGIFQSSWSFDWRAPSSPGTVTMNAAALSADDDGTANSNDLWNLVSLSIMVEAPAEIHDVAITTVTASAAEVMEGQLVNIDVIAENQGTETEVFDVTSFRDSIEIGKETVTLGSGQTTTLTFVWDTTGVAEGSYTISAEASVVAGETDTLDNVLSDGTVNVVVPPVASFTFSPSIPIVDETISFDASSSTPNAGTIVSYGWDFGDGTTVTETDSTTTHAYTTADTYTVMLTVTDDYGLTDTATADITVSLPPELEPPVASFTFSPTEPQVDETVTFDASGSSDPDGTIVSYNWDFGDGSSGSDATVTHAYSSAGDYTVTLVVTDNDGLTDSEEKTVNVDVAAVHDIVVNIDPDSLNFKSHGRWITAYIELPEGFDVNDIDLSSVILNGSVSAELKPAEVGDHDSDGIPDLMVKFDRATVIDLIENANDCKITLTINCQISGTFFEGYDSIRKIVHGKT